MHMHCCSFFQLENKFGFLCSFHWKVALIFQISRQQIAACLSLSYPPSGLSTHSGRITAARQLTLFQTCCRKSVNLWLPLMNSSGSSFLCPWCITTSRVQNVACFMISFLDTSPLFIPFSSFSTASMSSRATLSIRTLLPVSSLSLFPFSEVLLLSSSQSIWFIVWVIFS